MLKINFNIAIVKRTNTVVGKALSKYGYQESVIECNSKEVVEISSEIFQREEDHYGILVKGSEQAREWVESRMAKYPNLKDPDYPPYEIEEDELPVGATFVDYTYRYDDIHDLTEGRYWYEVWIDGSEDDVTDGTYDLQEAIHIAKKCITEGQTNTLVAVIDPSEHTYVNLIHDLDIDGDQPADHSGKNYFVNFGGEILVSKKKNMYRVEYELYWTDNETDTAKAKALGYKQITKEQAIDLCKQERRHRETFPQKPVSHDLVYPFAFVGACLASHGGYETDETGYIVMDRKAGTQE